MSEQKEFTIEPYSRLSLNLRELWSYRELFYFFTWRDVKVKYKQTILGILWVVLQPLLLMLIFTLFFGRMLGVEPDGMRYPVFAFSGLLLWNFFAASVTNAGNSMITNSAIIKKIYFPRLIIPISSTLAAIIDLAVTFILFLLFLFVYDSPINSSIFFFWPAAFLLALFGSLGLGCGLSALMIKYRDFKFIVPFIIQVGFFITPVVYPVSIAIPYLKYVIALNPMYGAITLFRQPLMSGNVSIDGTLLLISIISSVMLLLFGLSYFKKTELFFADVA